MRKCGWIGIRDIISSNPTGFPSWNRESTSGKTFVRFSHSISENPSGFSEMIEDLNVDTLDHEADLQIVAKLMPLKAAADVIADLQLCAVYFPESIPASPSIVLIHLEMVSGEDMIYAWNSFYNLS